MVGEFSALVAMVVVVVVMVVVEGVAELQAEVVGGTGAGTVRGLGHGNNVKVACGRGAGREAELLRRTVGGGRRSRRGEDI